jgi:MoaA/NifB/PqqE/SkfB family radical SAM enzyme
VSSLLGRLGFYMGWLSRRVLLGRRAPLNNSIILTDRCNLDCRHCTVARLGRADPSLEDVGRDLERLHELGSRMLVITGGEPFLWRDASGAGLEDVVALARRVGFFRTVVCTNGTFPLESSADYLWVSLDGSPEEHEAIRGDCFSRVKANIESSGHRRVYINLTISSNNWQDVEQAAEGVLAIRNVRGILFHLFTPYRGADESLSLGEEARRRTLEAVRRVKWKHPLRVFNTFAGIRALADDTWERPVWGSVTVDRGEVGVCCCRKGIYDAGTCRGCGCSPAVETWVLQSLDPVAVLENLRYL